MDFQDLDDFLVVPPIRLPIRGTVYEFPGEIDGRTFLALQRLIGGAIEAASSGKELDADTLGTVLVDDDSEVGMRDALMGGVDKQMADDGLTSAHIQHVFRTLVVWHTAGPEAAEKAWRTVGEVPAPNREQRRAASKGSASTTKSPASGSGTTTPLRKPGKGTPGPRSSAIGA